MVSVDLQERERVIEDMRLALTEQEETQTQLDLELDNRETQINELTQGRRLHGQYCIHNTLKICHSIKKGLYTEKMYI